MRFSQPRPASRARLFATRGSLAALFVCLTTTVVTASFPVVNYHRPLGVTRGSEVTITLYGERLGDAREALIDIPKYQTGPGIEIKSVKPIDERKTEIVVAAKPELAPGLYPFRLVTASGVSNLRFIAVGAMPVVMEKEPNNAFDAPQTIEMDRTVDGQVGREDVDYYQVKLEAGQRLTVEVEAIRVQYDIRNRYILDPFVAILDENRFEVAASDDSSLLQQDGLCSFTAKEAGSYTVMIRDSSFRGRDGYCGYRLHVGSFPRPVTMNPAVATTSENLKATQIEVDGTQRDATFQLPSQPSDRFPVITSDENGTTPSPNWMRVTDLPVVVQAEPNNDYRKGQVCQVPAVLAGVIDEPNDFDCYAFECKKGERYRIQLFARKMLRSPLDGVMNVFGPDNKTISSSDDAGGSMDGLIDLRVAATGTHTIRIYDHLRGGSPQHNYAIEIKKLEAETRLELKELRRDESHFVAVPQGGFGGMVVRGTRQSHNSPIDLSLSDLPEGVTATVFPIPASRSEIPVLLTAAADAPLGASLFEIQGSAKVGDKTITGELTQHHKLVLGQNRREMVGYKTDRAAAVVTEKMPFTVELVQPKTPILRRGSKELTVNIQRDEGFDGTVSFRTIYYPPGVSVNNSRRIEKGKSTVNIPVTANSNAALGQWPIVLLVNYPTARGTQTVATNPIMLTVEEPVFNVTFPRSACETGSEMDLTLGLEKIRDLEGDIEMQIVGLPAGVSSPAPVQKVDLSATSVVFPLVADAKARVGRHKTLNLQTRIKRDGEVMVQTNGVGELRVDKPLPPKKDAPKPEAKKPEPKKPAAPKPLSRLEQLRQLKEGS
ncbi:MAG: PPC domain-containing protein [Planctomycetota bacterium]